MEREQQRMLQRRRMALRALAGFSSSSSDVSSVYSSGSEEDIQQDQPQQDQPQRAQRASRTVRRGLTTVPAGAIRIINDSLPHGVARVGGTLQRGIVSGEPLNLDEERVLPRAYPVRTNFAYRRGEEVQAFHDELRRNELHETALMAREAANTAEQRAVELTAEAERERTELAPPTTLGELRNRLRFR